MQAGLGNQEVVSLNNVAVIGSWKSRHSYRVMDRNGEIRMSGTPKISIMSLYDVFGTWVMTYHWQGYQPLKL